MILQPVSLSISDSSACVSVAVLYVPGPDNVRRSARKRKKAKVLEGWSRLLAVSPREPCLDCECELWNVEYINRA